MTAFLLFLIFGNAAVVGGFMVLLCKKLMHSAVGLLLTLLSGAGLMLLTTAEFVAIAQIMVYAGGIVVLIIFGLMLTSRKEITHVGTWNRFSGTIVAFSLFCFMAYGLYLADFQNREHLIKGGILNRQLSSQNDLEGFSLHLLTHYLAEFELAGLLLLIALMGAATLASGAEKMEG
jgi:NADH:ubiquinone oxidoreductase subunit 6 (subunit J)